MEELDDIGQELLTEFLEDEFPVIKVREGRRYKKCIAVDGAYLSNFQKKYYSVKSKSDLKNLFPVLAEILQKVFDFHIYEINIALIRYLKLA